MAEDDMAWPEHFEAKERYTDRVTRGLERQSSFAGGAIGGGSPAPVKRGGDRGSVDYWLAKGLCRSCAEINAAGGEGYCPECA